MPLSHFKFGLDNEQHAFLNRISFHQLYVRIANENETNMH